MDNNILADPEKAQDSKMDQLIETVRDIDRRMKDLELEVYGE